VTGDTPSFFCAPVPCDRAVSLRSDLNHPIHSAHRRRTASRTE